MSKEKQVETGLQGCGDQCQQYPSSANGWSIRWRGQPEPGAIRLPNVSRRRTGQLVNAIEDEVIPRLILSQRATSHDVHADAVTLAAAGDECVEEFTNILLTHEVEVAYAYIDSIRVRGVSLSAVYLELLAPAARSLGEMWEQDRCGFAEVTLGLMQLRQVLHVFSRELDGEISAVHDVGPSALLVPVPGAQHSFGVSVVVEFFRRAGWDVCDEPVGCADDLLALVRADSFDLVGLSVGSDEFLLGLGKLIAEIRKAARNRDVRIMVGGKCFLEKPWLAAELGADATATDARQAVSRARNLVKSRGLTSK